MSNAKMPTLLTSYALSQLAGEPHTLIRLLNLQTVLAVGTDAWGRSHIPQPVLVSATISLAEPFASASSSDAVTGSTVHYGVLSKAILGACAEFESLGTKGKEAGNGKSLYALVMYLQAFITGVVSTLQEGEEGGRMRMLEVEVKLLKASLLGSSVSLKGSFVYGDVDSRDNGKKGLVAHSMVLRLHELKIPTLIGVNPNERLAKQMVVADIDIEKWDRIDDDYYKLENLVVQTLSATEFETLEALTSHLGMAITKVFIIGDFTRQTMIRILQPPPEFGAYNIPKIRIALAKPTAVMFADAPVIEVLLETDPLKSKALREIWEEELMLRR